METFNGIYGSTYTKKDENLEIVSYLAKGLGLTMAICFATMGGYATSEASKKLDVLQEEFKVASMSGDSKKIEDILSERDKTLKEHKCLPETWTKNYDNSFYFSSPTLCLKI